MPRMSVDSKFGRDPRVLRLAKACGWSRRETMGALFDVWEVCYERARAGDRNPEVLTIADIDAAAELDGFGENLIKSELGRKTKRGVRVSGAKKRVAYLKGSRKSGREGGIKSGEARRKRAKGTLREPFTKSNLPDSVPDPVPDTPTSTEREKSPEPSLSGFDPRSWSPEPSDATTFDTLEASRRGVVVEYALQKFRRYAVEKRFDVMACALRWPLFLAREEPTPDATREALAKVERAKHQQAARERERQEHEERNRPLSDEERAEVRALTERLKAGNYTPAENAERGEEPSRRVPGQPPTHHAKEATA